MNEIDPISIETIESLIAARRYEDATAEIFNSFTRMKLGAGFTFYSANPPALPALFTRFAAALAQMFCDPQFALSFDGFMRFCSEHATLHAIFRASGFGSADHVLAIVGKRNADTPTNLEFAGDAIPKLLVCWSLESEITLDFDFIAANGPQWLSCAYIGFIAVGGVHTALGYQRKIELLKKPHLLDCAPLPLPMLTAVGDCYMHCSYVDLPEKHEAKKVMNRRLRELVSTHITVVERTVAEPKERPTIIVPIEWFGSHHAMYRCYAPSIRDLRTKFKVIGVARPGEIDDAGAAEFDECVMLDPNVATLSDMVAEIAKREPDIMFYPSIGMASWWVALSTFRLAPVQVMAPGHPASSHSPVIDYIVSDGDLFGDRSHYTEECVAFPVGGTRYIKREGTDLTRIQRPNDGVFRMAIPAMVMKLVPPFLEAVRRISEALPGVEIHFFPNQQASGFFLVEGELRRWVPNAVIHARDQYQPYMEQLGRCDLMLSTFPFGGTNSTLDAFLCGVPVLTLEGDQIHSRSDASMIRRMGLPSWLITRTVDEYVQKAVMAATMPVTMAQARRRLTPALVEAEFYGEGPEHVRGAWANAFLWIWEKTLERQAAGTTEAVA